MSGDGNAPMRFGAERAPFVMLPRWLLHTRGVSDGAKVLYGMLHDLVAGREGPTKAVTRGELAECCGVSIDTVDRRLAELIEAGAVEKQTQFETRQGQLANVYWVRLSPRAADLRPPADNPGRNGAAPPAADLRPPPPQACGDPGRNGAAPTTFQEQDKELPPQPPRTAGGLDAPHNNGTARRAAGSNPRSLGANPRAEDETLAAERERVRVVAAEAEAERKETERRTAELAAETEAQAAEAERLALAATLGDDTLAAVVERVTTGLAGPLARSPLAVSREVVRWCRTAAARRPGPLATAITAALGEEWASPGDDGTPAAPLLDLPSPAPDAPRLQDRIRSLRDALDTQLAVTAAP